VRARWLLLALVPILLPTSAPAQSDAEAPGLYARETEAELDSLYAPLGYLMQRDEQGVYPSLSPEEKRAYLRRFWARRNPTPGALPNRAANTFNSRLAYVNRTFREGQGGGIPIDGWRTDRGRVYLENGPPDTVFSEPWPSALLPFQVWKYLKGAARKYCFVDVTLFGNFVLVYSTDDPETTRSDWLFLVGPEAARAILAF